MELNNKLENWLENSEVEFSNQLKLLDNNVSVKSNLIICNANFVRLKTFLLKLLPYIKYMRKLLDVENLIKQIINEIQNHKTKIPIEYSISINDSKRLNIDNQIYLVTRTDEFSINIIREDVDLVAENILVYVKNFDGITVFPVIKTIGNKIELTFNDKLSTNYYVYIM